MGLFGALLCFLHFGLFGEPQAGSKIDQIGIWTIGIRLLLDDVGKTTTLTTAAAEGQGEGDALTMTTYMSLSSGKDLKRRRKKRPMEKLNQISKIKKMNHASNFPSFQVLRGVIGRAID